MTIPDPTVVLDAQLGTAREAANIYRHLSLQDQVDLLFSIFDRDRDRSIKTEGIAEAVMARYGSVNERIGIHDEAIVSNRLQMERLEQNNSRLFKELDGKLDKIIDGQAAMQKSCEKIEKLDSKVAKIRSGFWDDGWKYARFVFFGALAYGIYHLADWMHPKENLPVAQIPAYITPQTGNPALIQENSKRLDELSQDVKKMKGQRE